MREIRRLLRPGGVLFISDMPLQDDDRNRARYAEGRGLGPFGTFATGDGGVVRHHPESHMKSWFEDFELISQHTLDLTTMHGNPATGVQFVARKVP
jgi:hypothetical protein